MNTTQKEGQSTDVQTRGQAKKGLKDHRLQDIS